MTINQDFAVTELPRIAPGDPGNLPPDLVDRLSALARHAVDRPGDDTQAGDGLRVALLALPSGAATRGLACENTAQIEPGGIPEGVPSDARAFLCVPLTDSHGVPIECDPRGDRELVLCASASRPRQWAGADRSALAAIATMAATELQLRAELVKHERVEDQLRHHPLHDPITELANRELFLDRLSQALLRVARNPERQLAVMSVSLDQFPNIETGFGYDAAHEVLREVGRRLQTVIRNVDSIARLAGDEFGLLLESLRDDSDAARVAERVHDAMRSPIATSWDKLMVTARIGVVLSSTGLDSPARLIQLAGLARARAKVTDSPYEIFDPAMQQRAQSRLHKEMELRRAVEDEEFELHYQPIIALDSGRIAKMEALMRWRHSKRGIVTAGEFITLAEELGLVIALGRSALSSGCRQLLEWRRQVPERPDLALSINITASHLKQRDLVRQLSDLLAETGLPIGAVNLEVTERVLIGDPQQAKSVLNELRALGVGIHLDDFGTGYSSLQYLHELPLDAIKIDRSFVARMAQSEREAQVVATIRELARQIGVPVVAEGIETAEQLGLVRNLGCEFAQGYFFSKAIPPEEMTAMLRQDPRW